MENRDYVKIRNIIGIKEKIKLTFLLKIKQYIKDNINLIERINQMLKNDLYYTILYII